MPATTETRDVRDLIAIFNGLFRDSHRTVLEKGGDEPLYLPRADESGFHRILFAHGYFSSALHEIAHWCIAGKKRRLLPDYGYWYKPDGRTGSQQREFERVEVAPQALEWIFSAACGHPFRFSADNLTGEAGDLDAFQNAVRERAKHYLREGLPKRARLFLEALCLFYGCDSGAHDLD